MVQKSFFALLLEDMKLHDPHQYDTKLLNEMRELNFKFSTKSNKILQKSIFQQEWEHKCERSLRLAKQLGNIYTGSLYNGLLSLVCDPDIDLAGKKILMFSYGSGCAASMFMVHVNSNYRSP